MLLLNSLTDELLCYDAEFIIPFLAEAADERFAQELVEADAAFCAEADGVLTDVPAMIVEACQGAKLLLTDRVEVAADGLLLQEAAV